MALKIGSRGITPNLQPTGFTPSQAPNLGPGIGSALTGLGVQVEQYAEWKEQKRRQEADRNAEVEFNRIQGETERGLMQMQRDSPEAATGFTEEASTYLRQQGEQLISRLPPDTPPEIIDHYRARFESVVQAGTTSAFTFEHDRTNQAFISAQRTRLDESRTRLYEDPEAFDIELAEAREQIFSSTLSAPEKEALFDEMISGMGQTVYQRQVEEALRSNDPVRDPDSAGLGPVAPGLTSVQAGLLSAIAAPESNGRYDVLNGGASFSDFADHPRMVGPGGTTTAAGKYQFTARTWDWMTDLMEKRGILIPDFSPVSQDRVALFYAEFSWNDYAKDHGLSASFSQALSDPALTPRLREALAGAPGARIWAGLAGVENDDFSRHLRGGATPTEFPLGEPADFSWEQHLEAGALRPDAVSEMDAGFRGGLAQLISAAPEELRSGITLYSGFRSRERQEELWAEAVARHGGDEEAADNEVARPGNSQHEHGNAADLRFNGKRLGEPGTEPAVEWLHANAERFGLHFRLGNEPWHIEGNAARSAPTATPGEYNPVPNAITDPRFANMPFEERERLTAAAQESVRARLADAAARERDMEVSTHASLVAAFQNGEEGSYDAIKGALETNAIRNVSLRDDLRSRISDHDKARIATEAIESTVLAGGTFTDADEKDVMTWADQSGLTAGVRAGDEHALESLVAFSNQTQYVPKPLLDMLTAQLGSADQQQAFSAVEALTAIYKGNPQAFQQYATEDQVRTATMLSTILDTSTTPAAALERQRALSNPAGANDRKVLTEQANEVLQEWDLNNHITNLQDTVLGKQPDMPVLPGQALRLSGQYMDLYREGYVTSGGDQDAAQKFADSMIQYNWSVDPLSGALMEHSPLAAGANVPSLGDQGKDWIEESVREQLVSVPDTARLALIGDSETRRAFANGESPTYQVAMLVPDENGMEIIDIPMVEDERGRLVPQRISMTPSQHHLDQREYEQELHRLESVIEGYRAEDSSAASAAFRSPADGSWTPGQSLTEQERLDLDRAIRRRDYLEAVGAQGFSFERFGPSPNVNQSAQTPTSVGGAMTATGFENLPPAPEAAPVAAPPPVENLQSELSSIADQIAGQIGENDTVVALRESIASSNEPSQLFNAGNDLLQAISELPPSQQKQELMGRLGQILRNRNGG